jgi:hypothetical protein
VRGDDLVARAVQAFSADAAATPPLTLRGGDEIDSYRLAAAFDPAVDQPTDEYLEQFTFNGLTYLDARSWRHYLPRLIEYTLQHPDDPRMVTAALLRSLRPPDRYPPRLGTLTAAQEAVVRDFLELVAFGDRYSDLQSDAQQALEEWWLPNPRARPAAQEIEALRAQRVMYRGVGTGIYRLSVPDTLAGSGLRDIPQESRRVETWGGYLCGDVHTVVAINVSPLAVRSLRDAVAWRSTLFREPIPTPVPFAVPGSRHAERVEGLTHGDSPAEPQLLIFVFAETGDELVTLSVRTWSRDDVRRIVERLLESLTIV